VSQPRCPGQDTRFWTADDVAQVACHGCGTSVEFWKDEGLRRCPNCGVRVRNPKVESGCAKWCAFAEQCLGYVPTDADPTESVCNQLIAAMKELFGDDQPRIRHTLRVLEFAEDLLTEEHGSPLVVKAAAVLQDIGVPQADRKYGSSEDIYQEHEGPPIARRIMENIGIEQPTIDHVCRIIAHHHSGEELDTPEFRIVWDADRLVNVPEEFPDLDEEQVGAKLDGLFRTNAGKEKAASLFDL